MHLSDENVVDMQVHTVRMLDQGRRVASGGVDGAVRLWSPCTLHLAPCKLQIAP